MTNTAPEFGKWRSILWPIHNYELKKLLPMFLMFFFVLFNYNILRDTKDTLVVTSSGAETIVFLKFWGTVPMAVLFMVIYAKLANILSKPALFYVTLMPFLVYFGSFAILIYPNRDLLHPTTSADWLQNFLPVGLHGLVACYRNWTYSLFYVFSELWGSMALSLLFWGFANDITKVSEAKRFYSLFGLGGNCALLIAGPLIIYFSRMRGTLPAGVDPWGVTLNYLMTFVVLGTLALMAVYWWTTKNILNDPRFYSPEETKKKKKEKPKMSLLDSIKYLASSKYMISLTILVISYGVCINLVEVTWKNQLHIQYPDPNDYSAFMGWLTTFTGGMTIFMMLFVGSNVIRRLGWKTAAMYTPVMLLCTGIAFFSFILFRDQLGMYIAYFGTTPLMMAVVIGLIQNVLTKSGKYSLFDPTKEMAYIPLDQEQKVKGKAAIDVVGARFGKSGGSLIQQGLIVIFGSLSAITPQIAVILMVIIAAWIVAVRVLNREFTLLTEKKMKPSEV